MRPRNVASVYLPYYPDLAVPEAAATIGSFAKLAVDNGVRRLVLPSGRVDAEDIADVVVVALTEDGHAGTPRTRREDAMLEVLRGATLVAATVAMGMLASLFYAFTVSVMPGLGRTDGRTFVDAMQRINVAIINPWFFVSFFGAPVLTIVAAALHFAQTGGPVLPWIAAAFMLYGVAFVITIGVNIPLNNALAATGPPDRIDDLDQVRDRFEATWVRWNIARAVASTAALGCLTWALVLYGRTTAAA